MRHRKRIKKLSREKQPRELLLKGLASDIVLNGKAKTTLVKAKVVRSYVEKAITAAKKKDTRMGKKVIQKYLSKKAAILKTFKQVKTNEVLKKKTSGYTRVTKLPVRRGDSSKQAVIELLTNE